MKRVLLLGATGRLGGMIAAELIHAGAKLRVYVRPGSLGKLPATVAAAAEVAGSEEEAFSGVDAVVSAVQGGPETIVDAQLRWLAAAREAGVRRFIPSDYSYNLFGLGDGENVNTDWRREFARRAESAGGAVEVVHVMNGAFLDLEVLYGFLGAFDLEKGRAYFWGDGNAQMDFTTYADTARYTAAAALDGGTLPREFAVAGESLNFHELVAVTQRELGREITPLRRGSLPDLDAAIERALAEQPRNFHAWLPLMYQRGMLSGKGKLGALQNARYPNIRPMGVAEYLRSVRDYLSFLPLSSSSSSSLPYSTTNSAL